MSKFFGFCFLCLVCFGCADGNCRSQAAATQAKAADPEAPKTAIDTVRVYKYDGSLKCKKGRAIPLDEMQKELHDIPVYSSENKSDGLMSIQVCGSPTGRANVYKIDRSQLTEAKKRGFKEWTFE